MAKKKPIVSKEGQWKYPGQETIIPNVNGRITMQGVPYPVLGIDDQGYSQMMMPGEEYQFPGNSVYEIPMAKNGGTKKVKIHSLPKAQNGGRGPATFQDSLDVANSAQQVIDWYKSQGYYGGSGVGDKEPARSREGVRMISMDKAKGAANKPATIDRDPLIVGGRITLGQKDDLGNGGFTMDLPKFEVELPSVSSLGEVGSMALAGTLNAIGGIQNLTNENLAEWESPYRFRQYADDHKRILNTDAPKALYDTRIDPRSTFILQGTAPGYFSGNADVVDMPIYEKFYTAPWSVLSPEDKRKRLEFGILDGTPFKDWNDPGLIQNYPDIALANGGRRAQGYDEQTIKNAAASGYAPTQEGAAQYEKNKWAKNPRVYDAQTIANAVKSGYPATQSGAAEYELNNWQKKPNSKNSIARKEPNPNTDIAHYMKTELGLDKKQTSYSERKKLAEKYGIKDYSGSAKQNIELLNKIKSEEDPADAVRRMLAGEKLNTVLPTDSQPEDFKVPYKGDPNRRSYPIELSGDAAIDNMRQQLFGNLGKFTDNGKIPLDDPKYNPYVGGIGPRTPEQEMKRIAIPPGGFAYGGQIPMAQMGMGLAPPPPRPAPMKYLPMKELGLLQMPGIDIKPQLQNIPSIELPQITKQRVVVNTAQGDKIRVQDPKTKKFMWWEDQKGLPSDIENPTGTASQDFVYPEPKVIKTPKFANGGDISVPDLRRVKINALPKAQKGKEWLDLGYENKVYTYKDNPDFFDSHARLSDNTRYNDWIKQTVYSGKWGYNPVTGESVRLNANQQVDVSPETKTLSKDVRNWTKEEKVSHPNSTIKNLPRTEVEQLRKEDAGFDQYATNLEKEAGKRTAAAQSKAMVNNPAFYAPGVIGGLAVAPELLGAELFGTGVTAGNILNPMFIGHGIKNTLDSDSDMRRSWSKAYDNPTGANLFDATLETGLNSLNFLGARALPGDIKAFGKGYQNIATGNSMIPYAWKSPAVGLSQEASADMFNSLLNSGKMTPVERNIVLEYQHNSAPFTGRFGNHTIDVAKRDALNNIINKYQLQFPQNSNAIATRRFNSKYDNLGANIENGRMNFGDRPTSFSAGVGEPGYGGAPDRVVIPSRYLPKMKNNFMANEYSIIPKEHLELIGQPSLTSREKLIEFGSGIGTTNKAVGAERELIGTGLDFKQIGKVKNDIGGFDYVVNPRTTAEAFKAASTRSAAGESGGVTLDKWPQLFGKKTAEPVNTPLGPQAELDLANARARAFSDSAFNKLKLQRFRPGQTFDVSNQEAKFIDNPDLENVYNAHFKGDPSNPSSLDAWFREGDEFGPSGRFTTNAFEDMNDIVAINRVDQFGAPAKNILLDTAHETAHSRSIRLRSTQGERDIATDAWEPMVKRNMANNNQWETGPADGFNQAAEESFAVQNELRSLLNDFDGSRVYTSADAPEIESALQKLASSDHPYLDKSTASQIDINKLIKSLNVIGLGAATPVLINAAQEKKKGGSVKRVKINALPNNWKSH